MKDATARVAAGQGRECAWAVEATVDPGKELRRLGGSVNLPTGVRRSLSEQVVEVRRRETRALGISTGGRYP